MKSSHDIRRAFLDYFHSRGHEIVASSPLVPVNDPTLLFTNAGMVQFKDVFLGLDERIYQRAASSQRCVRAGGKHNDLENVGYTARHHTFFEMLGNFSFGDYFKREAIEYAWDFLTKELALPAEKLWVTVFEDDDEAAAIWLDELGVDETRFSRCGADENFWSMGETGPCGPCSEIFYDHGAAIEGGPPGSAGQEGDRFVEIWNLVFMQFNRDAEGNMSPLPKPSVDTGMGLERLSAVLQGVHNNYEIDLFQSLMRAVDSLAGRDNIDIIATRVICDHIRSCAFLVADGVLPANEGRGYVLRRIIRRAIRHGVKLGFNEPFFYKLVAALAEVMGAAYPELSKAQDFIASTLKREEEKFAETLALGLTHLEADIASLSASVIPGEVVFKLYDTYGFPADLTADIARERGLELDMASFDKLMQAQRQRSQDANKFAMDLASLPDLKDHHSTFAGYESLQHSAVVRLILKEGATVTRLEEGEAGGIVLDVTPFYAEAGGQVGDSGELRADGIVFEVCDTQKQGGAHVHLGKVSKGNFEIGQALAAQVDVNARAHTVRNHSATHLLHAALRQVLGEHVTQKGSWVAADRLRFDFSHPEPVEQEQLVQIERIVNHKVLENAETKIEHMALEDALQSGAMSLFGEKYDAEVRVLSIAGKYSVELCGGTHVARAGDIGLFKIISEAGIAAGVRRVEAITGTRALRYIEQEHALLDKLASILKSDKDKLSGRLEQVLAYSKQMEKELREMKAKLASHAGDDMAGQAVVVNGVHVLARDMAGAEPTTLRDTVDQLKNKLGTAVVVLAAVKNGKVSLVAGVTKDCTDRLDAGELVNFVAQQVGGKGGGRADMAQAGGDDPSALAAALESVTDWVKAQV